MAILQFPRGTAIYVISLPDRVAGTTGIRQILEDSMGSTLEEERLAQCLSALEVGNGVTQGCYIMPAKLLNHNDTQKVFRALDIAGIDSIMYVSDTREVFICEQENSYDPQLGQYIGYWQKTDVHPEDEMYYVAIKRLDNRGYRYYVASSGNVHGAQPHQQE